MRDRDDDDAATAVRVTLIRGTVLRASFSFDQPPQFLDVVRPRDDGGPLDR